MQNLYISMCFVILHDNFDLLTSDLSLFCVLIVYVQCKCMCPCHFALQIMPDYYQFRHSSVAKRSIFPDTIHHVPLLKDTRVAITSATEHCILKLFLTVIVNSL